MSGINHLLLKESVPRSGIDTDAMWDSVIQRVGYLDTNYT